LNDDNDDDNSNNRMLRIFEPKWEKAIGELRKLHNEELIDQ
jgi:hypothetical protein